LRRRGAFSAPPPRRSAQLNPAQRGPRPPPPCAPPPPPPPRAPPPIDPLEPAEPIEPENVGIEPPPPPKVGVADGPDERPPGDECMPPVDRGIDMVGAEGAEGDIVGIEGIDGPDDRLDGRPGAEITGGEDGVPLITGPS
jgi:hypothetical protein